MLGATNTYEPTAKNKEHAFNFVTALQSEVGLPVWLENANFYSNGSEQVLQSWEHIKMLCQETGCGIIVDLAHLVVEANNNGLPAKVILGSIPWSDVKEIHLSGITYGQDGSMHDGHNHSIPDSIWTVLETSLLLLPEKNLDLSTTPIAFHIMNSQFLERDTIQLSKVASRFRDFIDVIKPLYVSDHLACFTVDDLPLPTIAEVNYDECLNTAIERITFWQNLLGTRLFLENFASVIEDNAHMQPQFFQTLIEKTDCGILFDISNAVLGWKNTHTALESWKPVFESVHHFHAGGFSPLHDNAIYIDSHAGVLAQETKEWIKKIFEECSNKRTLTIEFDHEINYDAWEYPRVIVADKATNIAVGAVRPAQFSDPVKVMRLAIENISSTADKGFIYGVGKNWSITNWSPL